MFQFGSPPPLDNNHILNNSFKSDQHAAHGDYMQLSLQLQFNERTRTK